MLGKLSLTDALNPFERLFVLNAPTTPTSDRLFEMTKTPYVSQITRAGYIIPVLLALNAFILSRQES